MGVTRCRIGSTNDRSVSTKRWSEIHAQDGCGEVAGSLGYQYQVPVKLPPAPLQQGRVFFFIRPLFATAPRDAAAVALRIGSRRGAVCSPIQQLRRWRMFRWCGLGEQTWIVPIGCCVISGGPCDRRVGLAAQPPSSDSNDANRQEPKACTQPTPPGSAVRWLPGIRDTWDTRVAAKDKEADYATQKRQPSRQSRGALKAAALIWATTYLTHKAIEQRRWQAVDL